MSIALDQSAISTALSRLADQLFLDAGTDTIDLVGIRRRGDEVSERVAALLKEKGANVRLGVLDISLYRDDFEHLHENPLLQSSEIDFSIDGSRVILVDDVIFTGRTIRAALDAIFDYGRPAAVELAVLIDRGHRELDHVRVGLMKTDGEDVVELTQK
jgi:pyrimidine operon attenuation protein/uracil phosphoribosyltransferase